MCIRDSGKHKGVFLEVEIPSGGGFSTGRAGNVVLQVNRPAKKKIAETKRAAVVAKKSPAKSEEK